MSDTAVVVGAGTMGHGVAQVLAMAGYETTLVDMKQDFVDKGLARIKKNLDTGVEKGKVAAADRDAAVARLKGTTELIPANIFIEAVPEDMRLKCALFADADMK